MPQRQSRHPDNDRISRAEENSVPTAQAGRSGGEVNRRVGTRAEEHAEEDKLVGEEVERATGADNPREDAKKGDKTLAAIQESRQS